MDFDALEKDLAEVLCECPEGKKRCKQVPCKTLAKDIAKNPHKTSDITGGLNNMTNFKSNYFKSASEEQVFVTDARNVLRDAVRLLKALKRMGKQAPAELDQIRTALDLSTDALETWFEVADPVLDGWVGRDGRP